MANGFVSDLMGSLRILSHGKITSLTAAFSLSNKQPFSIFVIPKANIAAGVISTPDNAGLLVSCKCYQDDNASAIPVLFNQWTEAAISEIGATAIDLTTYDVYWGAGRDVEES